MGRKKKSLPPCWHCQESGKCACIVCGYDGKDKAGNVGRFEGACVACAALRYHERHAAILATVDPRERRHWEHHAAHDGNKGYKVFLPLKGKV